MLFLCCVSFTQSIVLILLSSAQISKISQVLYTRLLYVCTYVQRIIGQAKQLSCPMNSDEKQQEFSGNSAETSYPVGAGVWIFLTHSAQRKLRLKRKLLALVNFLEGEIKFLVITEASREARFPETCWPSYWRSVRLVSVSRTDQYSSAVADQNLAQSTCVERTKALSVAVLRHWSWHGTRFLGMWHCGAPFSSLKTGALKILWLVDVSKN